MVKKDLKKVFFALLIISCLATKVQAISELKLGETQTIIEKDEEHKSLTCDYTNKDESFPIKIIENDVGFYATYYKAATSNGSVEIKCTWKENGYDKEKRFTWEYNVDNTNIITKKSYSFNDKEQNGTIKEADVFADLGMSKVTDIELNNNDGILLVDCADTKCTIKLNPSYKEIAATVITGLVHYKKTIGSSTIDVETVLIITANKGDSVYAHPGNYGTCEPFSSDEWTNKGGFYSSKHLGEVTLPTCTPKTAYPLLEFVGWTKTNKTGQPSIQITGYCENAEGGIFSGKVESSSGDHYMACYRAKNGIVVNGMGHKVSVDDTWTKTSTGYSKVSTEKIALPSIDEEGEFNRDQKFKGWRNQDHPSILAQPGELVEPDGSIYKAEFETEYFYTNYSKSIYIGETYLLNTTQATVTGCVSSDTSKIKVTGSGECLLTGTEVTKEPVDVTLYGENDYQQVYHVQVVSRLGMTEAGESAFVIDLSPNVIASVTDSSTLNTYFMDTCSSFKYNNGASPDAGSDPSGTSIIRYTFTCDTNPDLSFISYCLDAGRLSPTDGLNYVKSEQIDMNSDFGRLIGYMAKEKMFTYNRNDVVDVTILIRIVGIMDNVAIASNFNAGDETHAGSYSYYESIAHRISDSNGKIIPSAVEQLSGVSDRVKRVLINYQSEDTSEALIFERTIENIEYSEIGTDGSYTVRYTGTMLIPGDGAVLSGWSQGGFTGVVNKFEPTSDASKKIDSRAVYDFDVTISGNLKTSTLPFNTEIDSNQELSKQYSFRLTIDGAAGADAFLIEPSGRAASENFQRMLTINTGKGSGGDPTGGDSESSTDGLTIYVYFPPAPNKSACGSEGLELNEPSNPSLFRATGCCNVPAVPQTTVEKYCSSRCVESTMVPVCDYRESLPGEMHYASDYYNIIEGKKGGDYWIGGDSACIVETNASSVLGEGAFSDAVNKKDAAGNSLMVEVYKNNRYCRVSCNEEWQIAMEGFGSFTGGQSINGVAAGSYFQINKTDLFISGKRTCYTTFINYGNTNVSEELGKGAPGFTGDIQDESDVIVDFYNKYSNLSHVYADLACENDEEYTTSGGHTVKCDYSDFNGIAGKFCSAWETEEFCWNEADEEEGGKCKFKIKSFEENYCIDANGDGKIDVMDDSGTCSYTYTAEKIEGSYYCPSSTHEYKGKCLTESTGTITPTSKACATNKIRGDGSSKWGTKTLYSSRCYSYKNKSKEEDTYKCNAGDGEPDSNHICTHTYTKTFYGCEEADLSLSEYSDIPDNATDANGNTVDYKTRFLRQLNWPMGSCYNGKCVGWTPEAALAVSFYADDLMQHAGDAGGAVYGDVYESEPALDKMQLAKLAKDLKMDENKSQDDHMCEYSYNKRKANICTEYSICIAYYTRTTNGVDDGDKTPEGAETAPGQYVKYEEDSGDGRLNSNTLPEASLSEYTKSDILRTGEIRPFYSVIGSFGYENMKQARLDGADDEGRTTQSTKSRAATGYWKYIIPTSEEEFCYAGSYSLNTDGLSYDPAGFYEKGTGGVAPGGTNVMLRDVGITEDCSTGKWEDCHIKKGAEEKWVYSFGNNVPALFDKWGDAAAGGSGDEINPQNAGDEGTYGSCDVGSSCDTTRTEKIREAMLEGLKIGPTLSGYADTMMAANQNIVEYAEDMFACQHFELYNASDGQDNERKNNSLWTSRFMGTTRPFVNIVSTFDPDISYTYDEREYMTLLGNDNVMERYLELNAETYGCYSRANNQGTKDCYNKATNRKESKEIKVYYTPAGGTTTQIGSETFDVSRNYTENVYYNNQNKPWEPDSDAARSYGILDTGGASSLTLTCDNSGDCNIGQKLNDADGDSEGDDAEPFYKRTVLCSIGLTNDDPITVSTGDRKSSGLTSVYVKDKDYFWTAGTCFVNQVQYVKANYIKASIENSSFYKNKGYWYLMEGTDVKTHGDTLVQSLENANDIINAGYNTSDEELVYSFGILGDYNVFPIKMNTPRDIYEYTYTFSKIGSYGDGKTGRVMGNDQSLVAINARTCFYEVYEEICLCCGNTINSHVDNYEDIQNFIDEHGFYTLSKRDTEPVSSVITVTTSTISLSDINSDSDRELGSNWGENSTFFYNGDTFTTSKGAELLKAIQSDGKGENIYQEVPEYKFTINPTGMAEIRSYNDNHGYQVDFGTRNQYVKDSYNGSLTIPIGKYAMTPFDPSTYLGCDTDVGCSWEIPLDINDDNYPLNRIINFSHYESYFLSKILIGYKGVQFTGKYSDYSIGMSEDCYVLHKETTGFETSDLYSKADRCRWVDYVTYEQYGDEIVPFRLSFK